MNDSVIEVLNQPWLSSEQNPFISSVHLGLEGTKINQLMVSGFRVRDEDFISDLFNDRDRIFIQSIMFSDETGEDQ